MRGFLKEKVRPELYFTLFFVGSVCFVHALSYHKMPTRIHAWAQSDHYALALGFIDNEFDFFHPQTYSLNHQFPANKSIENPKGITAVDFPILHYIVGILMYATGISEPWVFRLVSLVFSYIGLFYLFKILTEIKGYWVALLVVAFIMFQPIYCYYQNGFHVSSAAFNVQLIGIAWMLKYWHQQSAKAFYWGVIFLTLAALMRFTQIITLIALFCALVYAMLRVRKLNGKLLPVLLGLFVVVGYFIYNRMLALKYGSVFLGSPLPADSLYDFSVHILNIGRSYLRGFLPFFHLFTLIIVVMTVPKNKWRTGGLWWQWFGFSLLGTSLFSLLMSWSLSAHDYYSLDTWMAPLTIGFIGSLYLIDFNVYKTKAIALFVSMFVIGSFSIALENQLRKYDEMVQVRGVDLTIENFAESSVFLNTQIPEDSKVLIITGSGWNSPMMGWRRQAYRVAWKFDEQIPIELERDYNFIVTQNRSFDGEVLENYPDFHSKVELVNTNEKVSVWRKK